MRRTSEFTESRVQLDSTEEGATTALPRGVVLYEINGPLFFGAAQKAMGALNTTRVGEYRVLVIHLGRVPVIDATGLVALENAIASVLRSKRSVVLAGPLPKPQETFDKAELTKKYAELYIAANIETALVVARDLAERGANTSSAAPAAHLPQRG